MAAYLQISRICTVLSRLPLSLTLHNLVGRLLPQSCHILLGLWCWHLRTSESEDQILPADTLHLFCRLSWKQKDLQKAETEMKPKNLQRKGYGSQPSFPYWFSLQSGLPRHSDAIAGNETATAACWNRAIERLPTGCQDSVVGSQDKIEVRKVSLWIPPVTKMVLPTMVARSPALGEGRSPPSTSLHSRRLLLTV